MDINEVCNSDEMDTFLEEKLLKLTQDEKENLKDFIKVK